MRYTKAVYGAIPAQLNKENKHFKLTQLKGPDAVRTSGMRFSRMESSFDWLEHAGVALSTLRIDEPRFPLVAYANRNTFKLYLNNVGLLMSRFTGKASIDVLSRRSNINYGSIYENAVAQELRASGRELHYYNNTRRDEVGFVVQNTTQGEISLVEVKSGKNYKRHVALNNLLSVSDYSFKNAYVLCNGNVEVAGKADKVVYLPIYMASFLYVESLRSSRPKSYAFAPCRGILCRICP